MFVFNEKNEFKILPDSEKQKKLYKEGKCIQTKPKEPKGKKNTPENYKKRLLFMRMSER